MVATAKRPIEAAEAADIEETTEVSCGTECCADDGEITDELMAVESPAARHYAEICDRTIEVQAALAEWQSAKDLASSLKKDYDRLNERLLSFISAGPEKQKRLFDDRAETQSNDTWRLMPVSELKIAAGLVEKLETEGLGTLGDLQDFWRARKNLHDLSGIGPEKAAAVADAFADFGAAHPELFNPTVAEPETSEADESESDAEQE